MSGRRWLRAALLSLPLAAGPALALPPCEPDRPLNLVAVQFGEGSAKVPGTFKLRRKGANDAPISVSDKEGDGTWTGQVDDRAVVGGKQEMVPDFQISGYTVQPVPQRSGNRIIHGVCYATFVFQLHKEVWRLEVSPTPETCCSFAFQRNGQGEYTSSNSKKPDWKVVGDLRTDGEFVDLKLYEIDDGGSFYLFHLSIDSPSDLKPLSGAEIAQKILYARTLGRKRGDEIKANDPYLPIAKSYQIGRGAISSEIASQIIEPKLKGLKLRDLLEDNP